MGKLGKAFLFLMAFMLVMTGVSRAAAAFTVAQVQVEEPQSRKIIHTVRGNGMVEKMKEQPVYAAADVLVAEIAVKEGQNVCKGDVLARLDLDSIGEKIQSLSDEIETLRLQNMDLAAAGQKEKQDKSRTRTRAQEDYENTIARGEENTDDAEKKVEDAKDALKEAKKQAKTRANDSYEQKLEELQNAVNAAQKAYDDTKELEESEVLQAKRTLEDAQAEPAADYGAEIRQIEINQKQQELNELYRRKTEGEEGLDGQIRVLEDEIRTLKLRQKEAESAAGKQAGERKQAVARAQEDYNSTVKKYARLVKEAETELDGANAKLNEFLEGDGEGILEDAAVKAAEEALEEARKALEEAKCKEKEAKQQAKRDLEDAQMEGAVSHEVEINRIRIEEKQRQLAMLEAVKQDGGKILAQMDGTITLIRAEVGQRTPETAVFLMSDTSEGMSFTTEISKEDAVYVAAGDTVTLKNAGKTYEELSVVSVETNEDESVKVTVYVPKDTLSLGDYADMELTKLSGEYSITVPLSAIHTENEKHYVYVMAPEDTVLGGQYVAQRMDVTVAERNELYAALTDCDLTEESQVITGSNQMVSAGEKVRLQEQ